MALPKGLKVSINNTPQGNEDDRDWGEAVAGTIQYVDVLANDLGGTSTTLVGFWNQTTLPSDLGTLLNAGALVNSFTGSGTGATISIESNQVKYDFSAFSDNHYDHLAQGQSIGDTFYYVLRMSNGAFAVAKVDVAITGENDTPTITSDGGGDTASLTVAENTSAVTTAQATDPDDGATLTYTIVGGADSGAFTINPSTGELSFNSAPNYEAPTDSGSDNSYEVQVQVSDEHGAVDTQTISVGVTDVNEAPTLTVDATPVSWAEDTPSLTVLADVDGTDPDTLADSDASGANDTFNDLTYSITSGNGAGLFAINASTGEISLAAGQHLDYETAQSYTLGVRVTDGGGLHDDDSVTINVTDVVESAAPTDIFLTSIAAPGGNGLPAVGSTIAVLNAVDADGTAPYTFKFVGAGASLDGLTFTDSLTGDIFAIDSSALKLSATSTDLNSPATYSFQIVASDSGGAVSSPVTFTIKTGDAASGDSINGSTGDDILYARGGNDTLNGSGGDDALFGQNNNDKLNGGGDNDILNGGGGDDTLSGGLGSDKLTGGAGTDTFDFNGDGEGVDQITDFDKAGGEVLDLRDIFTGSETLATLASTSKIGFALVDADGGGVANDTRVQIDLDGAGGAAPVTLVYVLNTTLTSLDTTNVLVN